jgi:hypothetical protein
MSGVTLATFMNQRSFGPPPPGAIGSAYEGGFYAGQIGVSGVATHYLVVGPVSSAQSGSKQYKNATSATVGAGSVIDGPQNTADIVADGDSTVYPAAHFCNNLVIGGFSDWYMPAQNELDVCYYNLKPTTTSNETSVSGINANAVPERTVTYTSGTPAQTSASNFKDTGAQDFQPIGYWSSTKNLTSQAWMQYFNNGYPRSQTKTLDYFNGYPARVRAIRRVAV